MHKSIDKLLYELEQANKKHTTNMIEALNTITTAETVTLPTADDVKPTNPKDACGVKKVPISGFPVPVLSLIHISEPTRPY